MNLKGFFPPWKFPVILYTGCESIYESRTIYLDESYSRLKINSNNLSQKGKQSRSPLRPIQQPQKHTELDKRRWYHSFPECVTHFQLHGGAQETMLIYKLDSPSPAGRQTTPLIFHIFRQNVTSFLIGLSSILQV